MLQFTSCPLQRCNRPYSKMASRKQTARGCFWIHELKYLTEVQRQFRTTFREDPPDKKSITHWYDNL